ncbi:PrpF protein [Mycobacterium sp. 21AC1]|uniref:PrpF domain-containing protein n=1 Tax=[Mycobacterium] appelbergii TaxID=2939269 RepID=UPI002939066A|nr:PrpF domain-containing protein [Mycobacterium sp. 21AC1]MDV3128378.1 PrpF protein [Mycobacterium sp. 21AC1]
MRSATATSQETIPVAIIRGGTSKGLYFHAVDLPPAGPELDRMLLRLMESPAPLQIDGLGGSRAVTSKVAIISPSARLDADVEYTFAEVSVDPEVVEWEGNCGNILAGVGPFAIDEGLIPATDGTTRVRIFNTNTERLITAYVPASDNRHAVRDDFAIPGVPGTGTEIVMDWSATVGAHTGRLLPTGNAVDVMTLSDRSTVRVTVCDVANPMVWVHADDVGARGDESKAEIYHSGRLLARLREIRSRTAELLGIGVSWQMADEQSPALPLVGMVAPPVSYYALDGTHIDSDAMDVAVRLMYMGHLHESLAGTAAINLGAASRVPGSTVADAASRVDSGILRAGHISGVMPVSVERDGAIDDTATMFSVLAISRTSRRLTDARVYLPRLVF